MVNKASSSPLLTPATGTTTATRDRSDEWSAAGELLILALCTVSLKIQVKQPEIRAILESRWAKDSWAQQQQPTAASRGVYSATVQQRSLSHSCSYLVSPKCHYLTGTTTD